MRAGEAQSLTWGQVDFAAKAIIVGRAKTANGTGRTIPMNADLASILMNHWVAHVKTFGQPQPEHFIFACGSP
jgi:integrase